MAWGFPYIRPSKSTDIPIPIEGRQVNINNLPNEAESQVYHLRDNEILEFQNLWRSIDRMDLRNPDIVI